MASAMLLPTIFCMHLPLRVRDMVCVLCPCICHSTQQCWRHAGDPLLFPLMTPILSLLLLLGQGSSTLKHME